MWPRSHKSLFVETFGELALACWLLFAHPDVDGTGMCLIQAWSLGPL